MSSIRVGFALMILVTNQGLPVPGVAVSVVCRATSFAAVTDLSGAVAVPDGAGSCAERVDVELAGFSSQHARVAGLAPLTQFELPVAPVCEPLTHFVKAPEAVADRYR